MLGNIKIYGINTFLKDSKKNFVQKENYINFADRY